MIDEKESTKEKNNSTMILVPEGASRRMCQICFGMGVKETPRGDTIDCPNRSCDNGYIKIKQG